MQHISDVYIILAICIVYDGVNKDKLSGLVYLMKADGKGKNHQMFKTVGE